MNRVSKWIDKYPEKFWTTVFSLAFIGLPFFFIGYTGSVSPPLNEIFFLCGCGLMSPCLLLGAIIFVAACGGW